MAVLTLSTNPVRIRWRNRRTTLQRAQWARLEDEGWALAVIGRDGADVLVSALRGDERASLRLRKDGTVTRLSGEPSTVRVAAPSIRYLSDSDAEARKLGY